MQLRVFLLLALALITWQWVEAPPLLGAAPTSARGAANESARGAAAEASADSDPWIELISPKGPTRFEDFGQQIVWCGDVALKPDSPDLAAVEGTGVVAALSSVEDDEGENLVGKEAFGDCEVRLEFLIGRGSNSGVKLHQRYEIQIFDSHAEEVPTAKDCGVYPHWLFQGEGRPLKYIDQGVPPRSNAALPPGQWQSLAIVFRAPRFDADGKKRENARFESVTLNGKTIHRNVELDSPTGNASTPLPEVAKAPLLLQMDHGPVAFRNVKIRPIENAER